MNKKNEELIRGQLYCAETLLHRAQPIDQHFYLFGVVIALEWLLSDDPDFAAPTDPSRLKKRIEDQIV